MDLLFRIVVSNAFTMSILPMLVTILHWDWEIGWNFRQYTDISKTEVLTTNIHIHIHIYQPQFGVVKAYWFLKVLPLTAVNIDYCTWTNWNLCKMETNVSNVSQLCWRKDKSTRFSGLFSVVDCGQNSYSFYFISKQFIHAKL